VEPLESLLTTEDVANYLKVDVVTVRRLVNRGDLAAYRVGGEYRFTRSDVVDYLHRQHIPARANHAVDQDLLLKQAFNKLTKRAKQSLWKFAAEEARNFKQPHIGTEHILLGLILEGEGVAGHVMRDLGVTIVQARAAVEAAVGMGDFSGRQAPERRLKGRDRVRGRRGSGAQPSLHRHRAPAARHHSRPTGECCAGARAHWCRTGAGTHMCAGEDQSDVSVSNIIR
jgi:excisionase family DNA binding protein